MTQPTIASPVIVADPVTIDRLAVAWILADADNDARISRGAEIAKAGGVERTIAPFLFLVISQADPARCYHVDHGTCDCLDAGRRAARACKHCWAVQLALHAERAEADALTPITGGAHDLPVITVEPEDEAIPYWPTAGEPCALPPQCRRCQAEPACPRHPDGLGKACIAAELYGEGV